jgi:hypothetical protein
VIGSAGRRADSARGLHAVAAMNRTMISGLVIALFWATACELRRAEDEAEAGRPTEATTIADTAGASSGDAQRATHVNVSLTEWSLTLDMDNVDAGLVTFSVANTGQYEHAFQIESPYWQSERLVPGDATFIELQLEPGTYYLSCPLQDEHGAHHELGEHATLIVR